MKKFVHFVTVYAPRARLWDVLSNLQSWPDWMESVETAQRLDPSALGIGSRIRLKQPKLPPVHWTITSWKPGKSFTWESIFVGLRVTARHRIVEAQSACKLELDLQLDGWLAPVAGALVGRTIRRYMAMEAAGLKSASEASPIT